MNRNRYYLLIFLIFSAAGLFAQKPVKTITDDALEGDQVYTWFKDTIYRLDGYVFLEAGGILNIEEGTIIQGKTQPSNGSDNASALIITRGAQIFARGTETEPIIFTSERDDIEDPDDLTKEDKGLWGGLILLGNGVVGVNGGVENVEGIPADEGRAEYGGNDNADNSGVLRFVSIRHGGAALQADNEINGLTLAGVGSATEIDFIEVFANLDDGIEWFGGAADVKHAVVAFCGDDSYDYDQSWGGRGQYWFSLQDDNANSAGEHDGSEAADKLPKDFPTIFNATYIGAGVSSPKADNHNLDLRDDAAALYANSIFTDFRGDALRVRNRNVQDSYARVVAGDTEFLKNIWFGFGSGDELSEIVQVTEDNQGGSIDILLTMLNDGMNELVDPQLAGISRQPDGGLDPRPNAGSPALSGAETPVDEWFDATSYRGAFSNAGNWAENWTALDQLGYFGDIAQRDIEVITDGDLEGDETYNWTKDKVYLLDGYVFLEAGGKLNIEAGTVIKGKNQPSNGTDNASALIITRGARIYAVGTPDEPIVFTAERDDVEDPDDLTKDDKGLWGGLIILGNAVVGVNGGVENVEGIPADEGRAEYGGTDNADTSGVVKYVSIRHGGAALQADNEINGLTLAGVGSGTEIDFIEVFANLDDGIEWFGGAVDVKHAVVSFCGDDSFDYDQSWGGRGQFWFTVQDDNSNSAGEHDGSEEANKLPKDFPTIYNVTYVGAGVNSPKADNHNIDLRDDAAALYANSIFTDFRGDALRVRNRNVQDSYARVVAGDTRFLNSVWFGFGSGDQLTDIVQITEDNQGGDVNTIITMLNDGMNELVDPKLASISRQPDGGLDPRLNGDSPALTGASEPVDEWFETTTYRGAFNGYDNWALRWTALDDLGYFGDLVTGDDFVITDDDLEAGKTYNWAPPNTYILDGYVFLEAGGKLNIEPGTVIKGKNRPSNGTDNASALIITRGAEIYAVGTPEAPVIFTAERDDITDPGDLTKDDKGLWGGLILLGNAVVGVNGGEENVEGIPADEGRAQYGGTNNDDNSGILKYVSIRHGGAALQADNEINGLTLAGVGRATQIDYIEVFANLDDGIEWFGGAADVKHAVVAFCGDDSFDYDQSWGGRGQFWFTIQDDNSNSAGEHDGSEEANKLPKDFPTIYNVTYVGAGVESPKADNHNIDLRDDAAAIYANSIFTDFRGDALRVRNRNVQDSYARIVDGDTKFRNNLWFGFGAGEALTDIVTITENNQGGDLNVVLNMLSDGMNELADPQLAGISRQPDGGLDPRPNGGSPALSGAETPGDNWFETTTYRGAFAGADEMESNWALLWTALDGLGYFGNLATDVYTPQYSADNGFVLRSYPNPATGSEIALSFTLPTRAIVDINLYDVQGRLVKAVKRNWDYSAGEYLERVNISDLEKGFYLLTLSSGDVQIARKVIVTR